jgi:hypothetical protein
MLDPQLFASNWGNLWAAVMAQPNSDLLAGRIVPDLVNEARWVRVRVHARARARVRARARARVCVRHVRVLP